jgi:hypothetical protein
LPRDTGSSRARRGRNQESRSEAVNAWYAVSLVRQAFGDRRLADLERALLAAEAASAQTYWQLRAASKVYAAPARGVDLPSTRRMRRPGAAGRSTRRTDALARTLEVERSALAAGVRIHRVAEGHPVSAALSLEACSASSDDAM